MNILSSLSKYFLLVAAILLLTTCKKDTVVPSYIHIESINLVGNTGIFGSMSHKITDAWVYLEDDNLQGVYELPATFPIRLSGKVKLRIIAGIKSNGIAATRIFYPFYTDTIMTVDLTPGKIDTIAPQVSYFPSTQFALGPVDFETGNPFTGMEYTTAYPNVFEGHTSGKMTISDTIEPNYAASGELGFSIPAHTAAAFLEMNYKSDATFTVRINAVVAGNLPHPFDVITLNPQTDWNKIYINLTPTVTQTQADKYQLEFDTYRTDTTVKPNIYFDNIKVVYFNQ